MTIQEKNPQRGQRGGGGRLTPVTSLQAAAQGETEPSLELPGPASVELVSPCAKIPLVTRRGWHCGSGPSVAPQHDRSCPRRGRDEQSQVSSWLPADRMLSWQLPPKTSFGSRSALQVSGADSGRALPAEEEPCRGRLSTNPSALLRHRLCQRVVERSQPAPFKNITRGTNDTTSPSPCSHTNALAQAGAATPAWVLWPPGSPPPIFFKRRITCSIYIYIIFFFLSGN